jgi:hypothetical protein
VACSVHCAIPAWRYSPLMSEDVITTRPFEAADARLAHGRGPQGARTDALGSLSFAVEGRRAK